MGSDQARQETTGMVMDSREETDGGRLKKQDGDKDEE